MIFAVGTHSFLIVVALDENWEVQKHQVLSKGYHFGVGIMNYNRSNGDRVFNRVGTKMLVYRGGKSVYEQNQKQLLVYEVDEAHCELVEQIDLDGTLYHDVHQIAYANGGVYLINTGHNNVVFRSLHKEDESQTYHFGDYQYDENHINSVFPCGDQIHVVLHNRGKRESEVVILHHNPSQGFTPERVLSLWNMGCHNVFFDRDILVYNASRAHEVTFVDLKRDRILKSIPFKGWHSKGMSVVEDYFVVGLSEHTIRDKRATSMGKLAVIDRKNLSVKKIIDLNFPDLPQSVGNVNEVRCISGEELGQATEQPVDINWEKIALARRNPLTHSLYRLRAKVVFPFRNVRHIFR